MQRNILIAGLTIFSVLFNTSTSIKAELAPGVNPLTIQNIERDSDNAPENDGSERAPKRSNRRSNKQRLATDNQQSMEYIRLGVAAHKAGNKVEAIVYYYQAIKVDETNGYAYMGAAMIAGGTKDGITCMKAAAMLFKMQRNQRGYDIATSWLEENGAAE